VAAPEGYKYQLDVILMDTMCILSVLGEPPPLLSFDLAKSLIPKISKEIGDAKRSQRAKDNQQSNPLTKGLNSFRKAARKFHCTAGSLQEVTSNEAIFKLADKHINTLAAEIHNLKSRDNDKFLDLAYDISEGDYSNAITWSENTII